VQATKREEMKWEILGCLFVLTLQISHSAPIPPDYSRVISNLYWEGLPASIPVLKSFHWIVTNVARSVNYGALGMMDATSKCWPNSFGPFTGNYGKRSTADQANPQICGAQNKTVSQAYAFYLVIVHEYPDALVPFSGFMNSIGLDVSPDTLLQSIDLTTDVGIGLLSGRTVIEFSNQDGVNSMGNAATSAHACYSDYTDYSQRLQNTAYDFKECNEWQPLILKDAQTTGFLVQDPVSPQTRWSWSMALSSHVSFVLTFPHIYANCHLPSSTAKGKAYVDQVHEVLQRVANLTDYTKMQAEHFEDKLDLFFAAWATLRFSVPGPFSRSIPWTSDDDVYFLAVGDSAGYAGAVAAWSVKYYTKSVRPRSVIRNYLATTSIQSWGGPYRGTVTMAGADYESYLTTMAHPSYPSGTTCFAEALISSFKLLVGVDNLPVPIQITKPPGSSKVEPSIPPLFGSPAVTGTPASTVNLIYNSLSEYAYYAGESRLDVGVHFAADVAASRSRCPSVGAAAYSKVKGYVDGSITTLLNPNDRDHYPTTGVDPLNNINWFTKLTP